MTQVLITRPLESANELAKQLQAHGLSSIMMPLYTFSPLQPSADLAQQWLASHERTLAVFTSPRAVRFGMPHIPSAEMGGLEFAAIGGATCARLEALGRDVQLRPASGFTSEDLLQLPGLASKPGLAIIFCAPGGRETLALGLEKLGWKVFRALVYERLALNVEAAAINDIETATDLITVWTSVSALELAEKQLSGPAWDKLLCTPALVISQRIQHHLRQLGAGRVELADGPGNADLLRSILRLVGDKAST